MPNKISKKIKVKSKGRDREKERGKGIKKKKLAEALGHREFGVRSAGVLKRIK